MLNWSKKTIESNLLAMKEEKKTRMNHLLSSKKKFLTKDPRVVPNQKFKINCFKKLNWSIKTIESYLLAMKEEKKTRMNHFLSSKKKFLTINPRGGTKPKIQNKLFLKAKLVNKND